LKGAFGRRVAELGDSSYLLYASSVLVLDLLIATPIHTLNVNEAAAIFLSFPLNTACVVIASVGYRLIERPLLGALKRLFLSASERASRPPAALSLNRHILMAHGLAWTVP